MSEEETSKKKEKEFFGIPVSDLGPAGLLLGGLALVAAVAVPFLKPQIDKYQVDMQNRQAYLQQQQLAAVQAQQQQILAQQQAPQEGQYSQISEQQQIQPVQEQTSTVYPQYAVEQDPFVKGPRRARIPEIEATEAVGTSRFNNISV